MKTDVWRKRLAEADERVLAALNEHFALVYEFSERKKAEVAPLYEPAEDAARLRRLCENNPGPMSNETLRAVYREIFSGALAVGQPLKVAFLGPVSTFTHQAALSRFGNSVKYLPQPSVADVFEAVARDDVTYGVVPVENSSEGAVSHTLDMFSDSSLTICAEITVRIHHNLLCDCEPAEVKVIYSHPQVFGQCRDWLRRNLPRVPLVEVSSTAQAVARCKEEPQAAAVAGILAAEQYNVPARETNIEDVHDNTTRFLVLGKQPPEPCEDAKTSLVFAVRDRVGALYDCLRAFGNNGVNLTFIESRPSRRQSWEYVFFVDIAGHVTDASVKRALTELEAECQFVRILGSYPRGAEPV